MSSVRKSGAALAPRDSSSVRNQGLISRGKAALNPETKDKAPASPQGYSTEVGGHPRGTGVVWTHQGYGRNRAVPKGIH